MGRSSIRPPYETNARRPRSVRARGRVRPGPCRPRGQGPPAPVPVPASAAGTSPGGSGRVGPARPAHTPAIGHVEQPAPSLGQALEAHARRRQPAERVRHRVGAEHRGWACPDHQATGGGGVVAEPDPLSGVARPPVAGDGDPHLGPAVAHGPGRMDAELGEGPGPARLDHHVGTPHQALETRTPSARRGSSATNVFARSRGRRRRGGRAARRRAGPSTRPSRRARPRPPADRRTAGPPTARSRPPP